MSEAGRGAAGGSGTHGLLHQCQFNHVEPCAVILSRRAGVRGGAAVWRPPHPPGGRGTYWICDGAGTNMALPSPQSGTGVGRGHQLWQLENWRWSVWSGRPAGLLGLHRPPPPRAGPVLSAVTTPENHECIIVIPRQVLVT